MTIPLGDRINVYRSKTTIYCEFNGIKYEIEWSDFNKQILPTVETIYCCFLGQILYTVGEIEHDNFLNYREYVISKLSSFVTWCSE